MSLTLYYHPLSSYCWKVLIALYENDTPFTAQMVNLGDPAERAGLLKLWPVGKFPVLRDAARDCVVPESSVIIDYLDRFHPGRIRFVPEAPDAAWQTRLKDRFYDLHVHEHMQKIVGDRLRPPGSRDPHGLDEARTKLQSALGMIDAEMATRTWATGDAFGLADCAATPPLFYANKVMPYGATHPHAAAYLERLLARPAAARVVQQAGPYFHMFPEEAAA
ncbi:glutathione S-transferase family protein [soil metagenome]